MRHRVGRDRLEVDIVMAGGADVGTDDVGSRKQELTKE
jgi:hypothetical protein